MTNIHQAIQEQTEFYRDQVSTLRTDDGMTYALAFEDDLVPFGDRLTTPHSQTTKLLGGCIVFVEVDKQNGIAAVPFMATSEMRGTIGTTLHRDAHSLAQGFAENHGTQLRKDSKDPLFIDTYSWQGAPGHVATYAKSWNNYVAVRGRQEMRALRSLSVGIPEVELCVSVSPVKWLRIKEARCSRLRLPWLG